MVQTDVLLGPAGSERNRVPEKREGRSTEKRSC